jgi:hypothetical protein
MLYKMIVIIYQSDILVNQRFFCKFIYDTIRNFTFKGWQSDSSGTAPAYQVWGSELEHQYKKKKQFYFFNFILHLHS